MKPVVVGMLLGLLVTGASQAATPPDTTSRAYQDGLKDRNTWEAWFSGLSGKMMDGAQFWADHRNQGIGSSCADGALNGDEWLAGCVEAKRKLTPIDARRKGEPQYWNGWNRIVTEAKGEARSETKSVEIPGEATREMSLTPIKSATAQVVMDRPVVVYEYGPVRITVLQIRRLAPERYEVISRFNGQRTGTVSYSRDEVDCYRNKSMEIMYGDTMEIALQPRPSQWVGLSWEEAGDLVEGSSRWRKVRLACDGRIYPFPDRR